MKYHDWNGHRVPLLVSCFNPHGSGGVEFHIKASSEEEAETRASRVLSQHHGDFLRKTSGHFETHYSREIR